MEEVGKSGEFAGKVCERNNGGGRENAGIHGEERREKGQDENKICKEDGEVQREVGKWREDGVGEEMLGRNQGKGG